MSKISSYDITGLMSEDQILSSDYYTILQELKKTRKLCAALDAVIENSADTIFIADGEANTVRVNKAYEELSGLNREELIGLNLKEMEGNYISKSGSLLVLQKKEAVELELHFYKTNRKAFIRSIPIFDENGNISMIISNSRNFEEIEKLKDKLNEAEQLANKYHSQIEAIREHLWKKRDIIAEDKKMIDLLNKAHKVARVDSSVLILGETGVGKGEMAKYIHENSRRSKEKFISINCGAISEKLIESEFFGYEKGAFTGANKEGKMGLFEVADKGTVFLDEIGELPLDMQVKLLRVLQEHEFEKIGGTDPIKVDIRVIAATNRDLKEMIKQKLFREDLFYRLNVVPLIVPPLRERVNDIIPLALKFLNLLNEKYGLKKTLSSTVYQALIEYEWPGNVRELKNVIEQAVIMSEDERITLDNLPIAGLSKLEVIDVDKNVDLNEIVEKIEFEYIAKAYEKHNSVRVAAKALNMSPSTFERKRKMYANKYSNTIK